ncbi:DnaD domain protein [Streptococcus uberis]|uniref:DnaD domain protein n=1 Tax=Streptococcus uberis TaxID=1349 RepID=UPI0027DAE4DD|nr:DnaD domain protein [Streptococcus uberis]MCK1193952.1 DnaD domain protein [Streptococcus uberis]
MAEEKRYWWLQLEHDFFDQKEIRALKRKEHGYILTTIYLELMLKSLKTSGSLFFDGIEDDFISELALEIDEPEDMVAIVFEFLKSKNLLVQVSDDEIQLPSAMTRIGSKTQSAVRKAKQRKREKAQSNVTVSEYGVTLSQNGHVKKRKEEKNIEREELELDEQSPTPPPILNQDFYDLYQAFEQETGKPLSPMQIEGLKYMLDDYKPDLILEALREAASQGKANFAYIQAILKRWRQDNLMTVELVRNAKAARERQKKGVQQADKADNFPVLPF